MPFKKFFQKLNRKVSSPRPDAKASNKDYVGGDSSNVESGDADSESYGLRTLTEPLSISQAESVYAVDIVFVHGLNGHWKRTWTHENGTFWPRDLLPHALPGARVFSYGYPTRIFSNKSVAGLRDFAKHLLDDVGMRRTESPRPIIYVCHSLGGIVVKQALITARKRNDFIDTWSASKAVIFMGTPHRGSSYATFGKTLGDIANVALRVSFAHRLTGGVKTSLIETLAQESGELQGVSEDFYLMIQESALHIISLYETEAHPLTNRTIVGKSSAVLGLPVEREFPLYLNHQDLCRFSGPQDANYTKVLDLIRSEASKEPGEGKTATSSLCTDHSYGGTEKLCASLLNTIDIADYQSRIDSRVEGTLEWVLQKPQYSEWASNPDSRLLWVTGYVGCGKTVLASFIWRYLNEQHSRALVCRFFCDEKIEEYRDPRALLRSLIFQIVDKRRRLWRIVKKASDAGGLHIFSQFDALWNLFVQLARIETKYPIMIIIDAIDELEHGAQYRVVTCILELLSLGSIVSVKFFITGRPNAEGEIDLRAYPRQVVHLVLEDSRDEIDSDIRFVIRHRLERMVKRGACKPIVRDTLEKMLVAKADQTFLWIKFVLSVLEKRRLLMLPDAERLVTLLPMTLASLYRHLLSSIPEGDQAMAAKMLRLLVICDRPLTGEEIALMLTITPNHRSASSLATEHLLFGHETVKAVLGDLVRIHGSHVELVHQSLKDYLTTLSSGIQDTLAIRFGVDRARDKIIAFQACSMYLCLEEFQQNIYTTLDSLEDVDTDDEQTTSSCSASLYGLNLFDEPLCEDDFFADESTWTAVDAKYQLFDYAALHWAVDFSTCDKSATAQDNTMALSLCETDTPQLRNWFHYYWYKQTHFEPVPTVIDRLMVVSYFGHASNLLYLLHQPDPIDPESSSRALYWAARQGHCACANLLLQQPGCDPQSLATKSQAPLSAAAQFGHLDCVLLLLKDARVNINIQDGSGRTPLSTAVGNNHAEIVTALLAHEGVDVNLQDKGLNTPLHTAIGTASDSIIAQLLNDKRAQTDQLDRHGRSILSWAAELGATESASLIIYSLRIPIDQKDFAGRTPLSYASQHGHLLVVRNLIETGHADPFGNDEDGRNAHSWAALHRSSDVLRYLTKRFPQGADTPDQNGWTPLAWTLDPPGYPENMFLLLLHGHVSINRKDNIDGRTILSWTARYGYTQMASKLIQYQGVDLEAQDVNGRTPLSEAAGSGSLGIVQLLIATDRVELNSQDQRGQTPLSWAVRGGHKEVVKFLLSFRATRLDVQNTSGETALDIARKLERKEILLILESSERDEYP